MNSFNNNQTYYADFLNQLGAGGLLANRLVPEGSYGRVTDTLSPQMSALQQQYRNYATSGLNHANGTQRALEGLSNNAANAGISSAQQSLLNSYQNQAGLGGQLVDQIPAMIQAQQQLLSNAQTVDPLVQDVINQRQAGLGGLNSAENTAFREQLLNQTNADYQNALRSSASQIGASGIRGAQAQARMDRANQNYLRSLQDLNQKQMLQNVAIQDSRLNDYDSLARYVSDSQFAKQLNALEPINDSVVLGANLMNNYGGALNTAEQNAFQNQQQANQNYLSGLQSQNAFQSQDLQNRLNGYANLLRSNETDMLNRSTFNLNQLAREQSDRFGIQFGTPQYINSQAASNLSNEIGYANLQASQQNAGQPVTPTPNFNQSQPIVDPYNLQAGVPYA